MARYLVLQLHAADEAHARRLLHNLQEVAHGMGGPVLHAYLTEPPHVMDTEDDGHLDLSVRVPEIRPCMREAISALRVLPGQGYPRQQWRTCCDSRAPGAHTDLCRAAS